jgi:hypothetical protein
LLLNSNLEKKNLNDFELPDAPDFISNRRDCLSSTPLRCVRKTSIGKGGSPALKNALQSKCHVEFVLW